jgi:hypothetical protein
LNDASVATIVACTVAGVEVVVIGPLRFAMPEAVDGARVSPESKSSRLERGPAVTTTDCVAGSNPPVAAVSVAVKV